MAAAYVPPGWPAGVPPPGTEEFTRAATNWLLDHCPPDFRAHEVLRRHPVALARLASEQLAAAVEACRSGYRTARAELADAVTPDVLEAVLVVYEREGRRLVAAGRAADLLGRALRGDTFVEPL